MRAAPRASQHVRANCMTGVSGADATRSRRGRCGTTAGHSYHPRHRLRIGLPSPWRPARLTTKLRGAGGWVSHAPHAGGGGGRGEHGGAYRPPMERGGCRKARARQAQHVRRRFSFSARLVDVALTISLFSPSMHCSMLASTSALTLPARMHSRVRSQQPAARRSLRCRAATVRGSPPSSPSNPLPPLNLACTTTHTPPPPFLHSPRTARAPNRAPAVVGPSFHPTRQHVAAPHVRMRPPPASAP